MTHNIIHDEAKIADLVYPIDLSIYAEKEVVMALKEYAEHTLVKFIDSEVERLEKEKWRAVDLLYWGELDDQVKNLQSLKAQLTKSK